MRPRHLLAAGVHATLAVVLSSAAVGQTSAGSISLQGKLVGVPDPNGNYPLTLYLHDAATGGTQVAAIGPQTAQLAGGVFSITRTVPAGTFDWRTLWWSVGVDRGTPTALQLVTSVPFASTATRLQSADSTDMVVESSSNRLRFNRSGYDSWGIYLQNPASGRRGLAFDNLSFRNPGGADSWIFLDQRTGYVGINRNDPRAPLDVGGDATIRGNVYAEGSGRFTTLTIAGGSDLAEPGDVLTPDGAEAPPGSVLTIHPDADAKFKPCDEPYSQRAAGVISGAGGLAPGVVLKAAGDPHADGKQNIAMTGKVWALCDADANGPIGRGDRLTTSATRGHAMKATDRERSDGAVIGKAMTELKKGKGLVLVLVDLQ